jgi:hypothetical protein
MALMISSSKYNMSILWVKGLGGLVNLGKGVDESYFLSVLTLNVKGGFLENLELMEKEMVHMDNFSIYN